MQVKGEKMRHFPRIVCPSCGWTVAVRRGKIGLHGRARFDGGCDCSGLTPQGLAEEIHSGCLHPEDGGCSDACLKARASLRDYNAQISRGTDLYGHIVHQARGES